MSKSLGSELPVAVREPLIFPPPPGEEPGGLPLRKLLAAFFRQRYLVFGLTVIGLLVGTFLALTTPNTYVSMGKFVNTASGSETVDVDLTGATRARQERLGSTAAHVLQTADVLKRVIQKLGPERVLAPFQPGHPDATGLRGMFWSIQRDFNLTDSEVSEAAALKHLQKTLLVEQPVKSPDVLIATCRANEPRLAQEILGVFMDEARLWHIETYDDPRIHDEVKKIYDAAAGSIAEAKARYTEFLEKEAQVSNFELELANAQSNEADSRRKVEANTHDIYVRRSQLADFTKRKETMEPQIEVEKRPDGSKMLEQIDAEIVRMTQEMTLQTTIYRPGPRRDAIIDGIRTRIEQMKKEREAERKRIKTAEAQITFEDNPQYLTLNERIGQLAIELAVLESMHEGLVTEHAAREKRWKTLRELEPKHLQLREAMLEASLELKANEALWETAQRKRQLRLGTFSSLKIFEHASLPLEKEGPQRAKQVFGGLIVGLFLAIAIVILRTLPDAVIRTRADLERIEGLPVIGLMPRLDGRNLRRHRALRDLGW